MANNFPTSPIIGQTYSNGLRYWVWTGTAWKINNFVSSQKPNLSIVDGQGAASTDSLLAINPTKAKEPTIIIPYENRGILRTIDDVEKNIVAVVEGLGVFIFQPNYNEIDDDESCFVADFGCWLLEAPSWDLVQAWTLIDEETQNEKLNKIVLSGEVNLSVSSLASLGQITYTVTVTGCAMGDAVAVTPNVAISAPLVISGRVSAVDTVTVTVSNPSASAASTSATVYIKVIKDL